MRIIPAIEFKLERKCRIRNAGTERDGKADR